MLFQGINFKDSIEFYFYETKSIQKDLITMTAQERVDVPSVQTSCAQPLPPPSLHMHLGRGLSSIAKSRRLVSWFDEGSQPAIQRPDEPEVRSALSETDLLSLFELPDSNESSSSNAMTSNAVLNEDSKQCPKKRTLETT